MSYIVSILENFLGEHKKHREDTGQVAFSCCECDPDGKKDNLEVNYKKGVFKCWSCKDVNDMYGTIGKLIHRYGSEKDKESYRIIKPTYDYDEVRYNDVSRFVEMPPGAKFLSKSDSDAAKKVKKYLYNRGIDDKMISYYKMMYSTEVGFKGRVIIPSFGENGVLEYYIARAIYDVMSIKYNNPEADKDNIIFFDEKINWGADIYLVEGVFDALPIPNSIPMLGKVLSERLRDKLRAKAKANVIVLLDDDAYDDAVKIYNTLNSIDLSDRVKIIKITNSGYDPSKIYEKEGKRGIINLLSTAHKI